MAEQDIAVTFTSPTLNVSGIGWVTTFARAVTSCNVKYL